MRAIMMLIATAIVMNGSVEAQTRGAANTSTWTPPRTADGHPNLDGAWENNVATPLERPRQLAEKPMLTEAELAALIQRARERFGPNADATFGDAVGSRQWRLGDGRD